MKNSKDKVKLNSTPQGHSIAWHHVRTVIPIDWEVSAYAEEERAGRLEFNNRHGLQGIVSWEPCNREPDRLTTMATFLARNIMGKEKSRGLRVTDILTAEVGDFMVGWLDDILPCQAMGYDAVSGHLVRWVFEGLSSKQSREEVIWPILKSFNFNNDEACCEYNMNGIHCKLPWDYRLEDIKVLPANVMMGFESEESKRKVTFRRWGLAEMVRGTSSLDAFYRPVAQTLGYAIDAVEPCTVSGHEALKFTFNAPREHHSDRFMRRRWSGGIVIIWHDLPANRIYTFEQIGPQKTEALVFEETLPGLTLKI